VTPSEAPQLLTFDIFGTVLDWRGGLEQAAAARGKPLGAGDFDRVIDVQGELEQGPAFDLYASIVIKSLVAVLGMDATSAAAIAGSIGTWALYPDSREALRRLMAVAPCAATTNSDRHHGGQVQAQLGFKLSGWICAEDVKHYKPRREIWDEASERMGVPLGPRWWHASAYADYDLEVARKLGLTTVFVQRPHARPGAADVTVPDLVALAGVVETLNGR
jgi:2-haloalkanoic acid dehalogenase type II